MTTTAVIVNYHCSRLTLEAVRSVPETTPAGALTVVVVDNSADRGEAERLRSSLPRRIHLLVNRENIGFARACNLAWRNLPSRRLLLLNPDARLRPGCLERLEKTLTARPRAAAVSPRVFWDEDRTFLMPPAFPVALFVFDLFRGRYARLRRLNTLFDRCWRCYAFRTWRAVTPMKVSNLAGAVVLLKAEAIEAAGGLFDPRFFLYFEDSDLFLRMRKAGFHLLVEPAAEAIHFYDQCAPWQWERKRTHLLTSRRQFIAKHFPRLLPLLQNGSRATDERPPGGSPSPSPACASQGPLTLKVPADYWSRWIFEWSPHPDFVPAVAWFGRGDRVRFPAPCWNRLLPGHYFGRLGAATPMARPLVRTSWQIPESRRRRVCKE